MFFIAKKLKKIKQKIEIKISEKIKNFEKEHHINFDNFYIRGYLFKNEIIVDIVTHIQGCEINPWSNIVFVIKYKNL